MKRRWTFDWRPYVTLWGLGGFVTWFAIAAATTPVHGGMATPGVIAFVIWATPFVVPGVLVGGFLILRELWRCRPRRISEPVVDDLRVIHPTKGEE